MRNQHDAVEAPSAATREPVNATPLGKLRGAQIKHAAGASLERLYHDDPAAVAESNSGQIALGTAFALSVALITPGGALDKAREGYNCGGYGCGFQPCICMTGAAEPMSMEHPPRAALEERIAALEAERDRYVEWNCRDGARIERLEDENEDLHRRNLRQAGGIANLLIDPAVLNPLRRGVLADPPSGAHLIWWPDHLPIPLFSGNAGAEEMRRERLSASWEHLPDPCVPPEPPGMTATHRAPPTLDRALRQTFAAPLRYQPAT